MRRQKKSSFTYPAYTEPHYYSFGVVSLVNLSPLFTHWMSLLALFNKQPPVFDCFDPNFPKQRSEMNMIKKNKKKCVLFSQKGKATRLKNKAESDSLDFSTPSDLSPSPTVPSLRMGSTHLDAIQTSWLGINTSPDIVIGIVANAVRGILDRVWNDNHYAWCDSLRVNISLAGVYFWPCAPVCMSQANS